MAVVVIVVVVVVVVVVVCSSFVLPNIYALMSLKPAMNNEQAKTNNAQPTMNIEQ